MYLPITQLCVTATFPRAVRVRQRPDHGRRANRRGLGLRRLGGQGRREREAKRRRGGIRRLGGHGRREREAKRRRGGIRRLGGHGRRDREAKRRRGGIRRLCGHGCHGRRGSSASKKGDISSVLRPQSISVYFIVARYRIHTP